MRFKCECSYDGTSYNGFQRQKNAPSIQEEIEKALEKILGSFVKITASGRTDSGVHAVGQVFHFDTDLKISENGLKRAINSYLPSDIHINSVEKVSDDFHARFDATKKEYHYFINFGEYDPIKRNYVYQYPYKKVNRDLIYEASRLFIGTIDFRSFTKNQALDNTIRTIYSIDFKWDNDLLEIAIIGNGFMQNMVRIMVAMWLEVGRGKIATSDLKEIIEKRNRTLAPKTAPGCGLYLYKVYYK